MRHFSTDVISRNVISILFHENGSGDETTAIYDGVITALCHVSGYRTTNPLARAAFYLILQGEMAWSDDLTGAEVHMALEARAFLLAVKSNWAQAPAAHVMLNLNDGPSVILLNAIVYR